MSITASPKSIDSLPVFGVSPLRKHSTSDLVQVWERVKEVCSKSSLVSSEEAGILRSAFSQMDHLLRDIDESNQFSARKGKLSFEIGENNENNNDEVTELRRQLALAQHQAKDNKDRRWRMELLAAEIDVELKLVKSQLEEERSKVRATEPHQRALSEELQELRKKLGEAEHIREELKEKRLECKSVLAEKDAIKKQLDEVLFDREKLDTRSQALVLEVI